MSEENFTVKELLLEVRSDVKGMLESAAATEEHLRTLNGRLLKAEMEIESSKEFRWKAVGGLAIISIVIGFIMKFIA